MATMLLGTGRVVYEEKFPGVFDTCGILREITLKACKSLKFSFEQLVEVELAVGESCINIVEHGYRGRLDNPHIEVIIKQYDNGLEVILTDFSLQNFPVETVEVLTPEEFQRLEKERGLGLFLIRTCVDSLEHKYVDGQGNITTLRKIEKAG